MPSTDKRGLSPLEGIKPQPFLKPAVEKVLERWQEDLARKVMSGMPLFTAIPRTPARGKVHVWPAHPPMAHPVWPYGTVIRPTAANSNFPDYVRQMVLNVNHERGAIVALQLTPPASDWSDIDFYMHSLSNLHERWEISEEVPD